MGVEYTGNPIAARRLDAADRLAVQALLASAAQEDGFWPMSDQLVADLAASGDVTDAGDARLPISVLVPGADHAESDHAELAGYAQASRSSDGWTMQVVVDPAARSVSTRVVHDLVGGTLEGIAAAGGGHVDWWLFQPGADATEKAAAHGFRFDRDLLQMRRALPVGRRASVPTRGFEVGQDEAAWLAVNNRAFADHHEQGTWTIETLQQRMARPWFDAAGFRLHERDRRLAAFCWTKRHDAATGEIYVIGVDPDFQGLGLGKQLTLAGLDFLADDGVTDALLYVDGANAAARALYEQLGFAVHRTDRAFSRTV